MQESQFAEYQSQWDEDFNNSARFMIQSSFIIDTIAKDQKLYATADDVEAKLAEYAQQTGIEIARVKEFYTDKDRRSRLAYQLTEEKVVSFLLSKADIKEVSKEELAKEEADAKN
jgi:trigger factor